MSTVATDRSLVARHFTTAGTDPLDAIEWERRDAWPGVEQHHRADIEVPAAWSQQALDIVSKLYLAKGDYTEDSVRRMVDRVVDKITIEGIRAGYSGNIQESGGEHAENFKAELKHILVSQFGTFNSPVWFNIGRDDRIQCCSACFLLHVDDNSESIMRWADDEAFVFKAGSGSGINVSALRGSMEELSTGGIASGPVSFMRMPDAVAGTFKSGGSTRRAAKLVRLDVDHPDIEDFIQTKVREERRLYILAEAGVNISMNLEGERNVAEATSYQNANNSVGVTDDFMERATGVNRHPREWPLLARKTGEIVKKVDAPELLDEIAKAAWECADPGLQFDTTVNLWHTTPEDSPIRTSNPCAETFLPDVSSCNLAHLNVLKFLDYDGDKCHEVFRPLDFRATVDVLVTAMDALIEFVELPTSDLTARTKQYRWLGLGYANMGAAIMAQAYPYDSDEARDFAASVTALLTGRAYRQSALLAERLGPFEGWDESSDSMLDVIDRHISHIPAEGERSEIWDAAEEDWQEAAMLGKDYGYRNAQATAIAPTGTTSFMLDCDTTGIEPAYSLVSHKTLAGGGSMVLINQSAVRAAKSLGGYSEANLKQIAEGDYSCVSEEDEASFHSANEISPEGHVKMVAAVQPFVSQGISKTVNVPEDTTWQEIRGIYEMAWSLGCKAISVYRDGSKARQVLSTKPKETPAEELRELAELSELGSFPIPMAATPHAEDQYEGVVGPERKRLPRDAAMLRHKFNLGGFEGYLLMGMYEDGRPGEIFLEDIGKEGSTLRGFLNAWAIQVSTSLQYGQPLEVMVRKYTNMNFEPNGRTENPEVPTASSIPDYIMRVLAAKFLGPEIHEELGILTDDVKRRRAATLDAQDAIQRSISFADDGGLLVDKEALMSALSNGNGNGASAHEVPALIPAGHHEMSGPPCDSCGSLMQRTGTCWTCMNCGSNTGCG